MPKDSILMHYLDSLVSADAKGNIKDIVTHNAGDSFFVINQQDTDSINTLLRKKIEVIQNIQNIRAGDAKIAASFFAPFAEKYLNLQRAYLVILQSYKKDISKGTQEPSAQVLLEIADKMILAAILEGAVYRDSHTHRAQLRLLEQLLYDLTSDWSERDKNFTPFDSKLILANKEVVKPSPIIRGYSETHNNLNIWRFTISRFWRWLTVQFSRAFAYLKHCISLIQTIRDNGLGSFFAYLAWVFFIPRILINFCTVIYSLIGTSFIFGSKKLPDIEKEYGWYLRLKIRLKEIFFEIVNDWMWCPAGIINCFSLAGALPIIGVYIMVLAQVYDFSVIMIRNFLDNRRLDEFKKDLLKVQQENSLEDPTNLINNFSERIKIDKKTMLFAVFNFMLLLMCVVLMTQAFGNISLFIPLVASFITIILAPMRGLTIAHFRKEAGKLNPSLIPKDSYGAILVDVDKFKPTTFNALGRYTQGVVGVKNFNGEVVSVYKYDKNAKQKLTPSSTNDTSKFSRDLTLYSRVKTVDKKFLEGFNISFDEENKKNASWLYSIKSSLVGFGA